MVALLRPSSGCRPRPWPWLIGSAFIHLVYFAALIESYRTGDLGQVYPDRARLGAVMTATATTFIVGETSA